MSSHDQLKGEVVNAEEISGMSDKQQAEIIECVINRYIPRTDTNVILYNIP